MHQNIEKQREIYGTKRRKDPNLEEQRNFEKQLINNGLHAGESVETWNYIKWIGVHESVKPVKTKRFKLVLN